MIYTGHLLKINMSKVQNDNATGNNAVLQASGQNVAKSTTASKKSQVSSHRRLHGASDGDKLDVETESILPPHLRYGVSCKCT